MPYFLVPHHAIDVHKEDGSLIELTPEVVSSALDFTPENAKTDDTYIVFRTLEDAINNALLGKTTNDPQEFPIISVDASPSDVTEVNINRKGRVTEKGNIKALQVNASAVTFLSASLKHINPEFADLTYDQLPDDTSDYGNTEELLTDNTVQGDTADESPANTTTWRDKLHKLTPALTVAAIASGFWQSGAVPGVVSLLAKVGVALPVVGAAAVAAQIGVAMAVGAVTYGVGLGLFKASQSLFNFARDAYVKYRNNMKPADNQTAYDVSRDLLQRADALTSSVGADPGKATELSTGKSITAGFDAKIAVADAEARAQVAARNASIGNIPAANDGPEVKSISGRSSPALL